MAMVESQESIQASLIEVINGLLRNTRDAKRAGLILRALNIAVRNARNLKFDNVDYPNVTEVPEHAEPETENVETAAVADEYLPAVAAVTYKPVDPRDPHWLERMEEGGRVLTREAAERRVAPRKLALQGRLRAKKTTAELPVEMLRLRHSLPLRSDAAPLSMTGERDIASKASIANGATKCRQGTGQSAFAQRLPQPSRCSTAGNAAVDPTKRKPPVSVKVDVKSSQGTTAARRR